MRRAGAKTSSSGGASPRTARATRSPQREPERVAVARVPACDPDAVAHLAHERDAIGRGAPDPRPAVGDPRPVADEPLDERVERAPGSAASSPRRPCSRSRASVAVAAEHEPPVGQLLPVVVAAARVVRPLVEHARERLRREHLPARRPDARRAPGTSAARVAVASRPRPRRASTSRAIDGSCSRTSAPAAAACAASRRTQRAGWSAPSSGWLIAPW